MIAGEAFCLEGAHWLDEEISEMSIAYMYVCMCVCSIKEIFKNKVKFTHFNLHLYGELPVVCLLAMVQSVEGISRAIQTLQHKCSRLPAEGYSSKLMSGI